MHISIRNLLVMAATFLSSLTSIAQDKFPVGYFDSPLDIPLLLAGNFGELRNNHFHGGLDIKTEGTEGKNVYAVAEGFISRIKISPSGYGKVLYITHPNGYTTVYAHLQRFSEKIETYTRDYQYRKEAFEIEIFPGPMELPVNRKEQIAYSGNTGSSGGPHLHFEIRETQSEAPLNPLLFGFKIKDDIAPTLSSVSIYPLDDKSFVNNGHSVTRIPLAGASGKYGLLKKVPIKVYGSIGFGFDGIDTMNDTPNRDGIYSAELYVDSELVYAHKMDRIPFHETRYINSHIDYVEYWRTRKTIERSFVASGNKLSIYHDLKNNGKLKFEKTGNHTIKYVLKDAYGNTSTIQFDVYCEPKVVAEATLKSSNEGKPLFKYNQENKFSRDGLEVELPANILYEDIYFNFTKKDTVRGAFAPSFELHTGSVPLHAYMKVAIKTNVDSALSSKAIAVTVNNAGVAAGSEGGTYYDGWLTFKTRSFGTFTVMVDTVKPTITALNVINGKHFKMGNELVFRIKDNLAGIADYDGYIDGQWVLLEYDKKYARLGCVLDKTRLAPGKHDFKLNVKDERGNVATFTCIIYID